MGLNWSNAKIILRISKGCYSGRQGYASWGREIRPFLSLSYRNLPLPADAVIGSRPGMPWFDVRIQCSSQLSLTSGFCCWWWSRTRCARRWRCTCVCYRGWSTHPSTSAIYLRQTSRAIFPSSGGYRQPRILSGLGDGYGGFGEKGYEFGITGEDVLLWGRDGIKFLRLRVLFKDFRLDGLIVEELLWR